MIAQASTSSDLSALSSAKAPVQVSTEAAKLNIMHRIATASTALTCAYFAALTILG